MSLATTAEPSLWRSFAFLEGVCQVLRRGGRLGTDFRKRLLERLILAAALKDPLRDDSDSIPFSRACWNRITVDGPIELAVQLDASEGR